MKTDIIYSNDVLLVNLKGDMLSNDYEQLKKRINYIINEYQINDIVFNYNNADIDNYYLNDLCKTFKGDNVSCKLKK